LLRVQLFVQVDETDSSGLKIAPHAAGWPFTRLRRSLNFVILFYKAAA